MAGASKQNDQLRQVVLSVLVSTRDGLSPARLAGELRDLLGPKAPSERELFEFVRKNPDVVRRRVLPNGRVILHGVVDTSVLHIKLMQERQKRSARRFNPPLQREISHDYYKKDPSQNGKQSVSATRENMFSMHTSLPHRQEMPSYPCNFATKVPTLPTKRQGALPAHPPGVLHREKLSVRRSCHGRGEVRIDFCSDGQREVPVCSTGDSKKPTHPPDTTQRRVSNEPFSAKEVVTIRRTNSRQREVPTQPIGAKQVVTSTRITGASQDKVLTSANYEGMHLSHCVSSKQEIAPKPANIRDSVPARPVDSRKEERTVEPLSYGYEMMCTVPHDVAMPGSRFQKLSSDFSELTFMPMYISAVCSPALFFVQLYGSSTADMLDDLMDDMDILYSDPEVSQQYSIPPSFLVPGCPCAAPYGISTQSWHRTLLLCLLPTSAGDDASMERQAYLYFVDYGDTCNVSISSLRLLRLSFMELPAQAIPAQLSYLHPPGEQWSLEARDYLLKLTCERVLMALVVGHTEGSKGNKGPVKEQGVKLSICLSDTTGKDDVHINDELVKQGLALQSRDAEEDLDPTHPYVMYLCKDDSVKTPAFKAEPSCIADGGCETLTQVSKPKMEAEPGEITEHVLLNLERLQT